MNTVQYVYLAIVATVVTQTSLANPTNLAEYLDERAYHELMFYGELYSEVGKRIDQAVQERAATLIANMEHYPAECRVPEAEVKADLEVVRADIKEEIDNQISAGWLANPYALPVIDALKAAGVEVNEWLSCKSSGGDCAVMDKALRKQLAENDAHSLFALKNVMFDAIGIEASNKELLRDMIADYETAMLHCALASKNPEARSKLAIKSKISPYYEV